MSRDHLNHQNSPSSAAGGGGADWQFGNQSMSMALPNYPATRPQVPMADSFYPNPWNNPSNPQNPSFAENVGNPAPLPLRLDFEMFLPRRNPRTLPPSIPDFPADSSFIERAAKFSSFSAGNFSALVNPFAVAAAASSESLSPYSGSIQMKNEGAIKDGGSVYVDHGPRCEGPAKDTKQRDNGSVGEEMPDMANVSGDSSSGGLSAKKKRKSGQVAFLISCTSLI